jgi:predicted Zn-dependent protease with MMP-like domain
MRLVPRQVIVQALPVTYERIPNRALQVEGIEADTLGLFVGGEFAHELDVPVPAQIILFLENIFGMVEGDEDGFRQEVRITLVHELGHYLGLDEDDLEERGLL